MHGFILYYYGSRDYVMLITYYIFKNIIRDISTSNLSVDSYDVNIV